MRTKGAALLAAAMILLAGPWAANAYAQSTCTSRGLLDARYCDEDGDLLADQPKDPKTWQNPATLVFSYTPVEDPSVYENVFDDFMQHLSKVTGKRVRWYPAESYAAQVEAMRSGRLHIAGVATGPTPYAVNLAGFQPVAAMQRKDGGIGYTLQLIVPKDSGIKSVADLKGKRVAHVTPSSNSGDIAPRALFAAMGVVPGKDYEVLYSGKHDNSIMGVVNKDYDAAPVASTVVERMQARGMFKPDALRVVYETAPFPRTAFGVAHNLTPELKAKIREAFLGFDFKKSKLATEFKDTERFSAIDYKKDWRDVLTIQKSSGVSYSQEGLSKLGTKAE
ncbi:MAG: phosphate/phosphite/phosphonate ABC transporter substrate-binding protein [Betaproteobacteria bacterium]|nr:MAG: phosphate/phosphite/phosphonate ABC transporter substrate-binding protein [Betaproteobacteria bacterium]